MTGREDDIIERLDRIIEVLEKAVKDGSPPPRRKDVQAVSEALQSKSVSEWLRLLVSSAGGTLYSYKGLSPAFADDVALDVLLEIEKAGFRLVPSDGPR